MDEPYGEQVVPGPDDAIRVSGLGAGCLTRLGIGGCLLLLLLYGVLWSSTVQTIGGADEYVKRTPFLATLTAAHLVAGGQPARLYDLDAQEIAQADVLESVRGATSLLPYTDPPPAAVLLAPLARAGQPPSLLFTAWAVLTTTGAGLCIGLLAGRWPAPQGTPWLLMLAATSFLPLISSLMRGQSTVLALLGWAGLTVALKAGREGTAGALGALAAFQPASLPALLLALLVTRRWRALAALLGVLAVAAGVVVPLLGPAWPATYGSLLIRLAPPPPATLVLVPALGVGLLLAWRGGWRSATLVWDLRWALTLLAVLLLPLGGDPQVLVLALVPAWMLAAHLANGTLAATRFWPACLGLGYLLGLPLALALPGATVGAGLWLLGALGGLLWSLRAG
jgi:hypothetical protein